MNAITVEILKTEGVANPGKTYDRIAAAGGFGTGGAYRPALDLTGLDKETRARVEKIIEDARNKK